MSIQVPPEAIMALQKRAAQFPEYAAAGGATFVTPDACGRYLRARRGDIDKAAAMLHETLKWRVDYKPDNITWADVAHEHETGKMYVNGFDLQGRPIIVMRTRNENTKEHDSQLRNMVYILRTAIRHMPPHIEQWVLIIDFGGYSLKNAPPMKTSQAVLNIMQNHFPERLARAVLLDPPTLFYASYKIVEPFVDKHTREKVCFLRGKPDQMRAQLSQYFDLSKLEQGLCGDNPFAYNHTTYGQMRQIEDQQEQAARAAQAGHGQAPAKETFSI